MADGLSAVLSRIQSIQAAAPSHAIGFAEILDTTTSAHRQESSGRAATSAAAPMATGERALPEGAMRWQSSIHRASAAAGIDPRLLTAVVWTESDFVPDAVSHAGAIGLSQLMPGTAEMLGVDPNDPEQNLRGGARYLSDMIDRYDGRLDLALAAYNAGPTRVSRLWDGEAGVPISGGYVQTVLDRYAQLGGRP